MDKEMKEIGMLYFGRRTREDPTGQTPQAHRIQIDGRKEEG
jgi:hypothetical protein